MSIGRVWCWSVFKVSENRLSHISSSVQKSYVVDSYNKPICLSDYAQSVLEMWSLDITRKHLPSVTADEMWDPETGEYNRSPLVDFLQGGGMSFNDMVKSG